MLALKPNTLGDAICAYVQDVLRPYIKDDYYPIAEFVNNTVGLSIWENGTDPFDPANSPVCYRILDLYETDWFDRFMGIIVGQDWDKSYESENEDWQGYSN